MEASEREDQCLKDNSNTEDAVPNTDSSANTIQSSTTDSVVAAYTAPIASETSLVASGDASPVAAGDASACDAPACDAINLAATAAEEHGVDVTLLELLLEMGVAMNLAIRVSIPSN